MIIYIYICIYIDKYDRYKDRQMARVLSYFVDLIGRTSSSGPWATKYQIITSVMFHPVFSVFTVDTPRCSMYGIVTYIWVLCMVNVGKYSIHGAYGTAC